MPFVTLLDVLRSRADVSGEREAYVFLADGEAVGERLTFGQLDRDARALGRRLRRHLEAFRPWGADTAAPRVLLVYPPGLDFIRAYLACFYAGVVAVPAYPPRFNRPQPRLRSILRDARPALALTVEAIARRVDVLARHVPEAAQIPWWPTDDGWLIGPDADAEAAAWTRPDLGADDLAFLQYTSGSTSLPKGVMVSHGNLIHNETLIQTAFGHAALGEEGARRVVSWLPLYHDMGLIGGVLQPLFLGITCVLMAPMSFLQKPLRWLHAISDHGCKLGLDTTSGGPNFAYELAARRATPEDLDGLDLSRWRVAFNGSEPVRASTLRRFAEVFEPCGFDPKAFFPCYGLAETTLFVTGGVPSRGTGGQGAVTASFDEAALGHDRVEPLPESAGGRALVASGGVWPASSLVSGNGGGPALAALDVAIVDPATLRRAAPGKVGEIWVHGPSVAQGYWANEARTRADFHATIDGEDPARCYLRTGDLGFLFSAQTSQPQLFVTGRLKDLILLRGRNYYPQDIELTLDEAHPAVRAGCGAAFAVDTGGEERLVVVQELERRQEDEAAAVLEAVRQAVSEAHELAVHEVVLLRAGTLPKTTSGKIQRHAARQAYLDGSLTVVARSGDREFGATDEGAAALSWETLDRSALVGLDAEASRCLLESYLRHAVAKACGIGVDQVSTDMPLPRLGLDSLAAVELQHRVESDLDTRFDLAALLEGATLAELASRLARSASQVVRPTSDETALEGSDVDQLSDGQRALWFLHRVAPESGAYHIAVAAKVLDASLTPEALRAALHILLARHDALRSTFEAVDGQPRLRIQPSEPLAAVLDWRVVPPADARELRQRLDEHAWAPFDLDAGPVVRVRWFETGAEPLLLLVVHHIVADFWSLGVLLRELGQLLSNQIFEEVPATFQEISTRDFQHVVARQRARLEHDGERLWSFWRKELADAPVVLELPTDRPRPARQSFEGGAVSVRVDAEHLASLDALVRHLPGDTVAGDTAAGGATRFQALLALYQLWLARLTGQRDLLVGTPWAGRDSVDVAEVVGYCVDPLVLRGRWVPGISFHDLLRATRRRVLDAFAHTGLPFPRLAERLQPQRDASRSPVFQAMLVLQRAPRAEDAALGAFALGWPGAHLRVGGLQLESVELPERWSQFDLTLRAAELTGFSEPARAAEGSLLLSLQYASALFDATTAQRWLDSFVHVLTGALTSPERSVDALPWLSPAQQHQLCVEFASAPCLATPESQAPTFSEERSSDERPVDDLATRFFATAARTPEAEAVLSVDAEGRIERRTYVQLAQEVRRLSAHLRTLGAVPEQPVGVLLPRGPELLTALLAILDAGAAYLPLDPNYPADRLDFTLRDAGARLLITCGELRERVPLDGSALTCFELDEWGGSDFDTETCEGARYLLESESGSRHVAADALAYLIYTSGSTGRPKGVAIGHRSALALLDWARRIFPLATLRGVAAVTSVCFDLSVYEIFLPLTTGGRVVLLPDALAVATLPAEVRRELTLLNTVPSAMTELLRLDAVPEGPLIVNLAGEPLTAALADALYARPEVSAVYNLYGPSEDTTYSTWTRVLRPDQRATKEPTIGRPVDGTRAYVLGPSMGRGGGGEHDPRPLGVPGELVLAGAGLARGYHGRPALTADRFRPEDGPQPGGRTYRTGDLARWRPDGDLEFLGRLDHQVKLRGYRIELGEIETCLTGHPQVHEAAVLVLSGAEPRLVAAAATTATGLDLPTYLRERLPAFMVPSILVEWSELPHTPNGKIDRRAVAVRLSSGLDQLASETTGTPPITPTEKAVASIWSEILDLDTASVVREDNFFARGGHSLAAARLTARLRKEIGVEVPLTLPFEAQTLSELAKAVDRQVAASSEGGDGLQRGRDLGEVPREERPRLSPQQYRLWLFDRLNPGSPAYNVPGRLLLRPAATGASSLDVAALERALRGIVERHEVLRTVYRSGDDGEPWQYIRPASEVRASLPVVDLTALAEVDRQAEAERWARVEALRPFDLVAGPVVRWVLVVKGKAGPDAAASHLLLTLHHIAGDGWSLGVLAHELGALYRGETLPTLPVQYADFAAWQRDRQSSVAVEEDLRWWRARLDGIEALTLPTDRPRPTTPTYLGDAVPLHLDADLVASLRDVASGAGASGAGASRAGAGATLFMLLTAVFQVLLGRLADQADVPLGTPTAGRSHATTEALIGFFVNTLVLRADLRHDPSFEALLTQVRDFAVGAFGHQTVSFERLAQDLAPATARPAGQTLLFQVMLAFNNAPFQAPELPGLEVEASAVEAVTQKFDLTLSLWERDGDLQGTLGYATDLFDRATAERWSRYFEHLLASVVATPTARLSTLNMLSDAERVEVLGWSIPAAVASPPTPEDTVPAWIAAQAERAPTMPAVTLEGSDEILTYGDLDALADAVGTRLRHLGARRESIVAVLAQRVPSALAAILGVWKAGAAFLPLDPTDPPERLRFVLQDAAPAALVTAGDVGEELAALQVEELPVVEVGSGVGASPRGCPGRGDTPDSGSPSPSAAPARDDLAYVLYTSGSTGKPKGAGIDHGALADYMAWARRELLDGVTTLPATARFGFDAAWKQLFGPLIGGGRVHLWPADLLQDPPRALHALAGLDGATAFNAVPSVWRALLLAAEAGDGPTPSHLRRLLLGGEALLPDLVRRTHALLPGVEIVNLYGPTETTANASAAKIAPHGSAITLGRPAARLRLYVLRPAGCAVPMVEPLPEGVPGELCIGGPGVARGYLGRPRLTAERFVPDSFTASSDSGSPLPRAGEGLGVRGSDPGARLYRTGDLVRWRRLNPAAPAEPEFLGRLDHQVKLRGVRLELGEIEAQLQAHPDVREAVALVVRRDAEAPEQLVALVVGSKWTGRETDADLSELRDHLRRRVPDAAVPSRLWCIDALPTLPGGKVDRRALHAEAVRRLALTTQRTDSVELTPGEQILAGIFAEVLDLDATTLARHDDFFTLGGHSLLATQVTSRIRAAFGVELPLRQLFEAPSLGELAAIVARAEGRSVELPPLTAGLAGERPPLSFAQQRLWLLDRLDPGSAAYNIPIAVELRGDLDIEALRRALVALVERHEILRTRFPVEITQAGVERPYQEIDPPTFEKPAFELRVVEAEGEEIAQIVREEGRRPFDLAEGPLLRGVLLRGVLVRDLSVESPHPRPLSRSGERGATALPGSPDGMEGAVSYLLLTLHHTVADGWSTGILLRELRTLYATASNDATGQLPPLPAQYADFAVWQRAWLQTVQDGRSVLDAQLDYWRSQLDADTVLDLPTDRPRPASRAQHGATLPVALSPELSAALAALARRSGATPFMVLLAAFHILLGRHAGQLHLQVGTPVAGRHVAETESLMGLFVNTLVLRGDLSGKPTFDELLQRTRSTTLDAYAHQDVPFEKLVEALVPHRDTARTPLFQALLALQNAPMPALRLERADKVVELRPLEPETGTSKFDLSLLLRPAAGGLGEPGIRGTLEYDTALFDRTTMQRLWRRFDALLHAAVAAPETPVHLLPLLDAAERHQLLREWNPVISMARVAANDTDSLPARVASQAPDRIAVVHGREHLSYAELVRRAEALADELQEHGAGPEQVVGLCLPRGVELVVAILGTLVSGAAYLPLDPAYPEERRQFSLEDGGAVVLVEMVDGGLSASPSGVGATQCGRPVAQPHPDPDSDPHAPTQGGHIGPPLHQKGTGIGGPGTPADHLAYLLYTSGSTGRPKGVLIPQSNVLRLLDATDPWFHFSPDDTWTLFHSYAFDFSVWELWGALAYGGRLVVVPYLISREPARFHRLLAEERVTVLNQTPSAFRPLIEADGAPDAPRLPLRRVIFGGEALEPASLRPWVERYGDEQPHLVNMYGITETTVHVTHRRLRRGDVLGSTPASLIGEAIPDLRLYVLDRHALPVPIGVVGELYVGAETGHDAGLARGYHGRPSLTAQRFVPDPFGGPAPTPEGTHSGVPLHQISESVSGVGAAQCGRRPDGRPAAKPHPSPPSRLYRSGDLVRHRPDGDLEYLGRADHQVKIRGFRIELGEIETALIALPDVREAAVLVQGEGDAQRLVAYVVGTTPDPTRLRQSLLEHLPDHMVPALFVPLDRLPLTPNGKLDRKALLALDVEAPQSGAYVAPRDVLEARIAAVWSEVLEVEAVGIHDDFFALGGHSLLAVQVLGRLRRELGVELPLARLFDAPTIAQLATHVRPRLGVEDVSEEVARLYLDAPTTSGTAPLSFAQRRLWLLHQLDPTSAAYHVPLVLELQGGLDVEALRRALNTLVERHAILRTRFVTEAGEPLQQLDPPAPVDLAVSNLDAKARDADIEAWVRATIRKPFDLQADWPLRGALLRLDGDPPSRHLLVLVLHHIAADGWSLGVLLRELGAALRGDELAPLPLQYADFARWQTHALEGPAAARLDTNLAYWRQRLDGLPPLLELPTDRPRPPVRRDAGARVHLHWTPAQVAAWQRLARDQGATLFSVLLAGFMAWLGRLSGSSDLAVGTPVAGRDPVEVEPLIGFFVNTLVLRGDLSGAPTFEHCLQHLQRRTLDDFAHRSLPFERLVEALSPERATAQTPLFQVMLALQNAPLKAPELPGVEVEVREVDPGSSKFDLTLGLLQDDDGGLRGALEYATDLFDATTARRWIGQLQRLLDAAAEAPSTPVAVLPLLSRAERHALHHEWATTPRVPAATADTTFPRRIAQRAALQPDATALVHGQHHLSYRQVWRRAAHLAAELQRRNVGPEVPVAVCLRRTPRLLVALLAVLEAGGFYVPLDPAYPEERLRLTVDDSGARLLLSERDLRPLLADLEVEILDLDPLDPMAGEEVPASTGPFSTCPAEPPNLAYLIYTSGSTGRPKGVAISHGSTFALTEWSARVYRPEERACVLAATSVCFDISIFELFVTLSLGGRIVLADNTLALPTLPAASTVTLIDTVPSAVAELLRDREAVLPPGVLTANLAGEALSRELLRRLEALPRPPRALNLYGPSEDTTFSTWAVVSDPAKGVTNASEVSSVSLGRLLDGGRGWVVDRQGQPVPIGVAGELLVGGVGVSRGYLGRPSLTAARYQPDPFCTDDNRGARLYRTGDVVRWDVDGRLSFLGRVDHQVKVRGFRIELGEVEARLEQHPALEAAVAGVRRWPSGEQLVAYLVGTAPVSKRPDVAELRAFVAEALPAHMVPARWRWLDLLPLTPNGKTDRRALAALPWEDEEGLPSEHAAVPEGPIEQLLASLWRETLSLAPDAPVYRSSNFFDLGGHSLLATRVVNRLREQLDVDLPLADLFAAPVLSELAARVEALRGMGTDRVDVPALTPQAGHVDAEGQQTAPLSFAQERLWFLEQLQPGNIAYNVPLALRLRPKDGQAATSVEALARALGAVRQRHDVLRTTFAEIDGRPRQVIAPASSVPRRLELPCVDLRRLTPETQRQQEKRLMAAEARRVFDLGAGPLVRAVVVLTGGAPNVGATQDGRRPDGRPGRGADPDAAAPQGDHIGSLLHQSPRTICLLLSLHHIVSDAWSFDVLLAEVAAALRDQELPPLPIQYADFAVWQRRDEVSKQLFDRQLEYWRQQLEGVPEALDLPLDRPRPALQTWDGDAVPWTLSPTLCRHLDAFGRRQGFTPYMLITAAFQSVLGRYAHTRDVCTGMPIAGRGRRETEALIGFFTNTLVLRARLNPGQRGEQLLRQVRSTALAAYDHQDIPFERLVDELQPARALGHQPLFQVICSLQASGLQASGAGPTLPGFDIEILDIDRGSAKFDLGLFLRQGPGQLWLGGFEFNTALFDRTTVERLRRHTEALLSGLLTHSELPVDALGVLTPAQRQQLLREWQGQPNLASTSLPDRPLATGHEPVQRAVLRRADAAPDATALLFYAGFAGAPYPGALSYGELANYVRRLSAWLQRPSVGHASAASAASAGVGPGHVVAVVCGRCPELFIALLATLETGAAFLPVDPTYPMARREFMLEDSGATVVLTQRDIQAAIVATRRDIEAPRRENPAPRAARPDADPAPDLSVDTPTYVIYTSGSTGRPKGTIVGHHTLGNLLQWQHRRTSDLHGAFVEDHPLRTLQFSSPSFDVAQQEIFATWQAGGTLVLLGRDERRDPTQVLRRLAEAGVERLFLPFVALQQLAELVHAGVHRHELPTQLREVITAGEQLRVTPQLRGLFRRLPGCRLWNHYGPSETHVVTAELLAADPQAWDPLPSIGRPVDACAVYLLPPQSLWATEPVPPGVAGEMCLAGEAPGFGYLRRPAATAAVFVPDPFTPIPGGRMYRSGDLARTRPDGRLDFLGRADHQVKVRGFRVELGEIETVLGRLPQLRDAVVVAREDVPGDKRLVAYLLAAPGVDLEDPSTMGQLKAQLGVELPEHMVPSVLMPLDVLPLLPSGKVDRKALPAPTLVKTGAAYVAPENEVEKLIAGAWKDVLHLEQVGVEDNFFEIGGSSLLIVQLRSRLQEALGRQIPLVELFQYPTVRAMGERFGRAEGEEEEKPAALEAVQDRGKARKKSLARLKKKRRRR